jgi:PAS domain S-box-containing protein
VSRSLSLHPRRFAVIGDLWDSPKTPIAVLEADRRYADVNDAFCDLTGYSREEMLMMRAGDLTVVAEAPVPSLFEKVSRHWSVTTRVRLRRKDGSCVNVTVRAYRCSGADGHLVVAIFSNARG